MISFAFTEEQEQFRATLAEFARKQLLPDYGPRSASGEYPWKEHHEMAEMGLLGIGLPAEFGGSGQADYISLGIACEEIGYGDINCASVPVTTGLVGSQLAAGATRQIQERWLPRLIAGEAVVGLALTEPDAGSDVGALRMEATPVEGGFRLSGEKNSVSLLFAAEAVIVYARMPGTRRMQGISAFLVELDQPGMTRRPFHDMGSKPLGRGSLQLDGVFVPTDHLVGPEGGGMALASRHFDYSRAAIGLQCLGAAKASLDEASAYVRQRVVFGRPLASFQGISLPLAEHYTYLEACRWMCYWALWLRQQGQRHTAQASMCKWWGPRVAVDAIEAALLFHGHAGYTDELPLQQRLRDAFGYLMADGTAEIQKIVVGREYVGEEVVAK